MSADRIEAMSQTYHSCARMFAAGGEEAPMLAHQEASSLLHQAALAMRAAEQSASHQSWTPDRTEIAALTAFYQPRCQSVAVWTGSDLVEFSEDEAEALHAALGDALSVRGRARTLVSEAEAVDA